MGKLLLLPNLLGDIRHHEPFLPASVTKAVEKLDGLIAESDKGGRRFLSRFTLSKPTHLVPLALYNTHTPDGDIDFLLDPMKKGETWGLVSDAGVPCVADPGYKLVARAKELGITVQAFIGPSSILLALMQSGLPAQRFIFHGYFPHEGRETLIKKMLREKEYTHVVMDAPYKNLFALEELLLFLPDDAELAVACELTLPDQIMVTQTVARWKKSPLPNIKDKPTLFVVFANPNL